MEISNNLLTRRSKSAFIRRIGSSKSHNFLNDSNLSFQDINDTDYVSDNKVHNDNQVSNENGLTNRSLINLNLNKSYDTNKFNHSDECKDLNQRLKELEKSNLHLKRMIQLVINDPVSSFEVKSRLSSGSGINNIKNPLGPPVIRQGRIGSSWRHIKQTNNYSNSNLLFIDGTVRINDEAKYPINVYGYPPKIIKNPEDLIGINSDSIKKFDSSSYLVRNQKRDLSIYDNQFNKRAQEGYVYWVKDPIEQQKSKGKNSNYTTGAYKTFYGLSDSLLKL